MAFFCEGVTYFRKPVFIRWQASQGWLFLFRTCSHTDKTMALTKGRPGGLFFDLIC